jgi:transposase InsO family protein
VTWAGDITHLRTGEGWLFLATVIDLYSRRVIGWSVASHMRTALVADALNMAVATRGGTVGARQHRRLGRGHPQPPRRLPDRQPRRLRPVLRGVHHPRPPRQPAPASCSSTREPASSTAGGKDSPRPPSAACEPKRHAIPMTVI